MLGGQPDSRADLCPRRLRRGEGPHDRDSRDDDAFARNALAHEDLRRLGKRDEPAVGTRACSPESVGVEIGDDHGEQAAPFTARHHPVEELGREEVRADDGVRALRCDDASHARERGPLDRSARGSAFGRVARAIQPSDEPGRALDHRDVGVAIERAEHGPRVTEDIDDLGVFGVVRAQHRLDDGLRGSRVS